MSLRRKTLLVIGVTLASLIAILYVTSHAILMTSFVELEEQRAERNVDRALDALAGDIANLDTLAADWAKWDDTYAFIEDGNDDYIQANLVDETFRNSRINLMLFIHSSGRLVFGKVYDLQDDEEIPVPQSVLEHLAGQRADAFLRNQPDTLTSVTGLLILPEGPLMMSAWPILTSHDVGPSRGTLIMGRYLDAAEVERLADLTHLSLVVRRFDDPQMPPDFQAVRPSLSEETPITVRPLNEEFVAGYALLEDIYGEPGLVLKMTTPRDIYQQGQASIRYFLLSLLGAGLVTSVVTLLFLERLVLSRLAQLSATVSHIRDTGDLSAHVVATGKDELSRLAGAINGMLDTLELSEKALRGSLAAERASREQAEVLREAAQVMGASLELNDILRLILDQLKRVLVYDTASVVILREEEAPDLVVGVGYADEELTSREAGKLLRDSPILRRMARDLQPVVSADVRQLAGWIWVPGAEHVCSWLAIPVVSRGRMIGALMADHSQPGIFGERELQIAQALARHAAQAIENAQLFERIQEQAQQVRQIMDTVPEGVALLDATSRILLTNPAAQAYLAALTGAGVGESLTHLGERPVADLLATAPQGLWHEVTTTGTPSRVFEVEARPMETGPEAGGWVLVLRDVTQERETQQRVQAQDRLAAVGQLAAGIAHDFNNILTGIIGYAELLYRHPETSDYARERLQIIVGQGHQAAQLIRQILDFSRQSISEKYSLDLLLLFKEIVKLLQHTIPESIRIAFVHAPGEYRINADPTQLQRALINLAINARDAMPDGGEISIQLSRLSIVPGTVPPFPDMAPGQWFVLTMSDTGTGIAPEHIPHLFEPFFTTKDVGKGMGLGLAQVYGLVGQHGGFIDVASEVGEGTTFTIYLPALEEEKAAGPAAAEVEFAGGQGETILLVEDEPTVLEVSKAMLERLGYRVRTATSGEEALQVYDQHQDEIALVLTDMVMPRMDGIALFKALQVRNPGVKVVMMSGYPLGEKTQEIRFAGILDWLQKPVEMAQLVEILGRVSRQASSAD